MEKSEVQLWLRNPVTVWFLNTLKDKYGLLDIWHEVTDDKLLAQLQGIKKVFHDIEYILDNPESE